MFSTLGKGDVCLLSDIWGNEADLLGQHSQKKRHIASQYANTNILRPQVMRGIQERANEFVKKCVDSGGEGMEAYVGQTLDKL